MHVINYLLLIERAVVKGWLPETNIYLHVAVVATIHNSFFSRLSGCLFIFSHSIGVSIMKPRI